MVCRYSWISKFLWYSTLKSIISKNGGNFSFRYLSFISNNIFHIFSIRIHVEHISQSHTQKDRSNHFSEALKTLIILFLGWFGRKRHGFLNPRFYFFTMFPSNKVSLIITLIFLLWVIKINSRFNFYIIIITRLSIIMNIIINIFTRFMFITRLCFGIRHRDIIWILRWFCNRFTRSMQSPIIFLFLTFRRTRCINIISLRILLNSLRVAFRIQRFLSHSTSSSSHSNNIIIFLTIHFIEQFFLRFKYLFYLSGNHRSMFANQFKFTSNVSHIITQAFNHISILF